LKSRLKLLSTYNCGLLLIALFTLFTYSSCKNEVEKARPKISQDNFINVLLEMHIATSAKQLNLLNPTDSVDMDLVRRRVYATYGVNETDLKYAIDYYSTYPDSMTMFYTKMIEKLSIKQAELNK
jgi:Domain of unknown function (DUF4296)